jgi:hypothetical protein
MRKLLWRAHCADEKPDRAQCQSGPRQTVQAVHDPVKDTAPGMCKFGCKLLQAIGAGMVVTLL